MATCDLPSSYPVVRTDYPGKSVKRVAPKHCVERHTCINAFMQRIPDGTVETKHVVKRGKWKRVQLSNGSKAKGARIFSNAGFSGGNGCRKKSSWIAAVQPEISCPSCEATRGPKQSMKRFLGWRDTWCLGRRSTTSVLFPAAHGKPFKIENPLSFKQPPLGVR